MVKQKTTESAPIKKENKSAQWLNAVYLIILMFVVIQVYNKVYDEKLYLGGDNVAYYINAKSFMQGEGYSNIHMPGSPSANHYPPGYSLISAVIMALFGDEIEVMNKANGFFLFGSLAFFYLILLRITRNQHLSFVMCLITGLNFHILNFSIIAMSEIPFVFTSMASLFFLMQTEKDNFSLKDYNFWLFLFFLVLSYFIRTAGIALIGGVILYLLFEKKWKLAGLVTGIFLLFAASWFVRSQNLGGSSYASQLLMKNPYQPELGKMEGKDWITRVKNNVKRYVSMEIPSSVFSYKIENYKQPNPGDKKKLAGILVTLLAASGIYFLREFRWLFLAYMGGTAFILALWPDVWFGTRFMLPIIPFLMLLLVLPIYAGAEWLARKINLSQTIRCTILPFGFLAIIPFQKDGIKYLETAAKNQLHPNYARYFELAKYAKATLPKDAIIVCRKPELFFLYANRKVVNYINSTDADSLISDLQQKGVTHVVIEQLGFSSTARYLNPALQKRPEKFKLIKQLQNPDTYLFEINYDMGYTGDMVDGKRHGFGTIKSADGSSYEGEWVEDRKEGKGKFVWSNGMSFEGEFKNNVRNGSGVMVLDNGNILEAIWVNDTLNGYAKMFTKDRILIREGMMKNNSFIEN
ncbi:MAG: phospholipid carrier-dependent glycosyltransferase [Flavobacteriales bacterium]